MPTLAENRKARHDYEILETYEAGLKLSGPEVKSAKTGRFNLEGSYAVIDTNREAWLINAHIAPYPHAKAAQIDYQPDRSRKLLLKNKEISYFLGKTKQQGLTILPILVYTKGSLIKVKLALAKGRKKFDKRQTIRKEEVKRQISRTLRQRA